MSTPRDANNATEAAGQLQGQTNASRDDDDDDDIVDSSMERSQTVSKALAKLTRHRHGRHSARVKYTNGGAKRRDVIVLRGQLKSSFF